MDKAKIMAEEVERLIQDFIKQVKYPERLTNVMVVSKKNGRWRVCIDF